MLHKGAASARTLLGPFPARKSTEVRLSFHFVYFVPQTLFEWHRGYTMHRNKLWDRWDGTTDLISTPMKNNPCWLPVNLQLGMHWNRHSIDFTWNNEYSAYPLCLFSQAWLFGTALPSNPSGQPFPQTPPANLSDDEHQGSNPKSEKSKSLALHIELQ